MILGIVFALAGMVGLAQGLAFLRATASGQRLAGVALAPIGALLFGVGLVLALVPAFP